nr:MAG TPA: hypothetical protein [Caudoviricetes sp.]
MLLNFNPTTRPGGNEGRKENHMQIETMLYR